MTRFFHVNRPALIVWTAAILMVLKSAAVIAFYIYVLGTGKLDRQLIRFALATALSVSLVRGWKPGRYIALVLLALSLLIIIFGKLSGQGLLLLQIMAFVDGIVFSLLMSESAATYFEDANSDNQEEWDEDDSDELTDFDLDEANF